MHALSILERVYVFDFELPANPAGNYLEISNFLFSGWRAGTNMISPMVKDIWWIYSNPALLKVVLQPSAVDRKLVLMSTGNY